MRFALLLAVLGAAPDAGSERIAVVAGSECDRTETRAMVASFRDQLRSRLGPRVLSEADTAAPLGGLTTHSLAELQRSFAQARDAFFAGRTAKALQELVRIDEETRRLRPSPERWQLLRQVLAARAQVELKSEPESGRKTLRRLLGIEPEFEPPPGEYPPSYVKELASARAAVKALGTNRLDVRVEPSGKQVFVGGRPVGTAPASLRMTPGDYLVEADFGHRSIGRLVTVPRPTDLPNAVSLAERIEGAIDPSAGPCIAAGGRWEPLGRVLDLVRVDRLLILRADRGSTAPGLTLTEYVPWKHAEVREQKVPLTGPAGQPAKELAERVPP